MCVRRGLGTEQASLEGVRLMELMRLAVLIGQGDKIEIDTPPL